MKPRTFLTVLLLLLLVTACLKLAAAEPLDVWHWRDPESTGVALAAVAHGGGRYVAVGDQGAIQLSEDGAHWYPVESPTRGNLRAVAWGDGQWMAVGDHGDIVSSSDGLAWTRQDAGVFHHLNGVTRGNGQWVAVGDESVILTSPDGRNWTPRASGSEPLRAVTWAEGLFVAGGGEDEEREARGWPIGSSPALLLTSFDGLEWTRTPVLAGGPVTAIAHGSGRFVAMTGIGTALLSEDGAWWQAVPAASSAWEVPHFLSVTHGGTRFLATFTARFSYRHQLWTSPDGDAWSPLQVEGLNHEFDHRGLVFGPGGWVAVGSPSQATAGFGVRRHGGDIAHSGDGQQWQSVNPGPVARDGYYEQMAFAGGLFFRRDQPFNHYTLKEQTLVQVSSTGRQWEGRLVSPEARFSLPAFGHGQFVCVGRDGRILRSQDARLWEPVASGVTNSLFCLAYADLDGRFIAGGSGGLVLVSSNGLDWTSMRVPTTNAVVLVAASNGRIVAGCSERPESAMPFVFADALYVLLGSQSPATPVLEASQSIQGLGAWEEGFHVIVGGRLLHSTEGLVWNPDAAMGPDTIQPVSGGGRLLVFRQGFPICFERRAGEADWHPHQLPWQVRQLNTIYYAPVSAAYGHGTFLLAHGTGGLIQSEPIQPMAPSAEPAPAPTIVASDVSPVTFWAAPLGSEPIAYQWRLDGRDLPGANSPYLTVTNLAGGSAAYTCQVTNVVGGAEVGPFRSVVVGEARLDLAAHGLGIRVQGTPGARYRLERSGDLRRWTSWTEPLLTSDGMADAATGIESFTGPPFGPDPTVNTVLFFRARPSP